MLSASQIWYLFPLLVTVSLVYAGTRYEEPQKILHQAYKSGVWMLSFMLMIFAVIFAFEWCFL